MENRMQLLKKFKKNYHMTQQIFIWVYVQKK